MRKLLFGMFMSAVLFSWFVGAIVDPAVDAVKSEFNSAVIEPLSKMEQFMNDPSSISFD